MKRETPDILDKARLMAAEAAFVDNKFQQKKTAEPNLTQEQLAIEMSITQGVVGQWLKGITKIPDKRMVWLANRLGFDPTEVRPSIADYAFTRDSEQTTQRIREPSRTYNTRIAIVGNAQAGPDGYWDDMGHLEHGDGFIVASSKDPDAYALRVRGDSMAPAIKNGQIVVIEPNSPVHQGENVLVCTTDGLCMIKEYRLYNETDEEYTFGSINDQHPAMTVQKTNITRIQPITMVVAASLRQA
jgi:phage repressor protein C with HTH and peptisase S24 domain